jgi:hypothetical protein
MENGHEIEDGSSGSGKGGLTGFIWLRIRTGGRYL